MPKIESTDEAWESGELGASEEHAKPAPQELEAEIDASLGVKRDLELRKPS